MKIKEKFSHECAAVKLFVISTQCGLWMEVLIRIRWVAILAGREAFLGNFKKQNKLRAIISPIKLKALPTLILTVLNKCHVVKLLTSTVTSQQRHG